MNVLDFSAIRAAASISVVARRYVKLVGAGREWKACCPFHEDRTPSFTINDEKGFYHCFGCGAHGDVLDLIQAFERVDLRRAAEIAGAVDAAHARAQEPRQTDDAQRIELARTVWNDTQPIGGTPGETYLRSRGIICAIPDTIRFARLPYGKRGPTHPCLVAALTDLSDRLTGIQRTFLNAAGTGKASVPKPKLSLGRIRGGAIRLAPVAAELVIAEGLEDALTLQQELGSAAWATAGAENLRSLELPLPVRSVIVGADSDVAGEQSAREAAQRFAREGRRARIIRPEPGFKDFNAELQGASA